MKTITATTSDGVATNTYTPPNSVPTEGKDTITVRTSGGKEGKVDITLIGPSIASITLTADPESLPADDRSSRSTISAKITLVGGGDAPDGTKVTFTISKGQGDFGKNTDGTALKTVEANTAAGTAVTTLYSSANPGTATIRAEAGGKIDETEIEYTPGSVSLVIIPNSILGTGDKTANVTASVKDANGDPVGDGTVIKFSVSPINLGTIDATALISNGEAEAVFHGGKEGGTVEITAVWTIGTTEVKGTATIEIQSPPAFMNVKSGYPDPVSVNIKGTGGQSTSLITFEVKDSQGNLVSDGYRIDFILSGQNGGEVVSPLFAYTEKGEVSTVLTSGLKSGPVSIKATYYNNSSVSISTSQIAIEAGPPVGEAFGIGAEYVNISGLWKFGLEDAITITTVDAYGNAIPDNTAISFKTYNTGGYFDPASDPTVSGQASSSLISSSSPAPMQGFVSATAEAIGGRSTRISSLAVTPYPDNHIIYAGTNGGGVYKSTDRGATWENFSRSSDNWKYGQNWIAPYIKGRNAIAVDPDDVNTVFVGTDYLGQGRLYRSVDGGLNWNSDNIEEWNGIYSTNAAILTVLCDGGGSDYVWVGTEGNGVLYTPDIDAVPLTSASSGLTYGKNIWHIVKVEDGQYGENSRLYAGTTTGIYRSNDGGKNWKPTNSFTGNYVKVIALHPNPGGDGDVIYAGTEDAGLWVSVNSGQRWEDISTGLMGKGLSASLPIADKNNKGNGVISKVEVLEDCLSENWSVTCIKEATDTAGAVFEVKGSISGNPKNNPLYGLGDYDISTGVYEIPNIMRFTITKSAYPFVAGDKFTFLTTRDEGKTIKDFLVDAGNNRLYAITYFQGALEPHSVGNVYVHELRPDGSVPPGDWEEANLNLPQYDPPDDKTLYAQHVLAGDIPGYPTSLFIGGEGINLFKAVDGLDIGKPEWKESKSGLTNLIMARMPILFSGSCTMDVSIIDIQKPIYDPENPYGDPIGYETVGINSGIGNDYIVTFKIYIQDSNGNPPVSGSNFKIEELTTPIVIKFNCDYPDLYVSQGTYSDPANPPTGTDADYTGPEYPVGTNNPFIYRHTFESADFRFTFTPKCVADVPGCSGSTQAITY